METPCLKNGELLTESATTIPLSNIEYAYGFGVYETVRVVHGTPLFLDQHLKRLLVSAAVIGLEHMNTEPILLEWATMLLSKAKADSCNLKILLIGGRTPQEAIVWMMLLRPLFPDKRLFTQGSATITVEHERFLPHAKTLNMLPSYLFYRKAKAAGCEDALLFNRSGCLTEGTRTNLLALRGRTIVSPPREEILEGVTRANVLTVAMGNGFTVIEEPIPLGEIGTYDGFVLTSTSSKIVPIRKIDDTELKIPETVKGLMKAYDQFLDSRLR